MTLAGALASVKRLAVDTAPIIYFIQEHPRYLALVNEVFQRIDAGAVAGVTSMITLTEVLVLPMKEGNSELQHSYAGFLLGAANFSTLAIDERVATAAAAIRASTGIRTPDALQVACAVVANCDALLTNDRRLTNVSQVKVLVLDDFLEP